MGRCYSGGDATLGEMLRVLEAKNKSCRTGKKSRTGTTPPPPGGRGKTSLKEEPKGEGPCGAVGREGAILGGDMSIRQYYNFLTCIN